MADSIFITHYSGDKALAELVSSLIRRISLHQIIPWHSSDTGADGGLKPGDLWFQEIVARIRKSTAVVALITPNSVNRPWVYFESGLGQAVDCSVIPLCIGVGRDSVVPPLSIYQCYQFTDYRSVVEFVAKLMNKHGLKFDEEMSRGVVEESVKAISKASLEIVRDFQAAKTSVQDVLDSVKSHIDQRFVEVLSRTDKLINENVHYRGPSKPKTKTSLVPQKSEPSYTVGFRLDLPGVNENEIYAEVWPNDTFQNMTDSLYLLISDHVRPYTYLEEWVIVEPDTSKFVIIREIANKIPARSIFKPGSFWTIMRLRKPYTATDSKLRILSGN